MAGPKERFKDEEEEHIEGEGCLYVAGFLLLTGVTVGFKVCKAIDNTRDKLTKFICNDSQTSKDEKQ